MGELTQKARGVRTLLALPLHRGAEMGKPDGDIIESGRRWMAGEVSDDEYFSKVARSATAHPGREWINRIASLVAALFKTRST
jgi:hypothetical protein